MIKQHDQNQLGQGRVDLAYIFRITILWGKLKPGGNLKAGVDAGAMDGCCILASHGLPILLLRAPRTTSLKVSPPTMNWELSNQPQVKNIPTSLPAHSLIL